MTNGRAIASALARGVVFGPFVRPLLALAALWLIWTILADRLGHVSVAEIWSLALAASPAAIAAALVCTALSFTAVAAYDIVAFRAIGRPLPARRALRNGFTATSIGQFLGLGVVTGGFARWRMTRADGVEPAEAAKATVTVAAGFFLGLAVVVAATALIAPDAVARAFGAEPDMVRGLGAAGVATFAAIVVFGARGGMKLGRFRLTTARPRVLLAQVALAALDLIPAALALWLLMPTDAGVAFAPLFVAYVAALAVGLLSNAPGGVGVFETVLLLSLPDAPVAPVLAGVLLFRVVYYAAPFFIGLLLLARVELRAQGDAAIRPIAAGLASPADIAAAIATSSRAEANLAYLGDKRFLFSADGDAFMMYGARAGALVAMGDPVGPRKRWPELMDGFLDLAALKRRTPVFYKIDAATAALARARGLAVDRIGHEAELDPQTFALSDRSRRQLRRKVTQARKAGLTVRRHGPGEAPLDALTPLDAEWRGGKGGREAGFSMGRFDADYLSRFPVFIAERDGAPVAFLSLWLSGDGAEWSIDLMRAGAAAPHGATQLLIVEALEAAKDAGADRFNLCMAPLSGLEAPETGVERLLAAIYEKADRWHGLKGLRRFKASFGPEWRPRFVARQAGPAGMRAPIAVRGLVSNPVRIAAPVAVAD